MADEVLELTEEMEEIPTDNEEQVEEKDEIVPTFEDEEDAPPPEEESSVIREMRAKLRERDRELAELRKSAAPKPIEVGEKPTLESCDYDEEAFEEQLLAWKDRKSEAEKQQATQAERQAAEEKEWSQRADNYRIARSRLPADFADYEAEVQQRLPVTHQNVLLMSEKSAELVHAIGRSPAKLAELSKITNPVLFAMAIGKLEDKLQMTSRKAPSPDRPLTGNASVSGSTDKTLERLEKEAERTGNWDPVLQHKRAVKAQAKK